MSPSPVPNRTKHKLQVGNGIRLLPLDGCCVSSSYCTSFGCGDTEIAEEQVGRTDANHVRKRDMDVFGKQGQQAAGFLPVPLNPNFWISLHRSEEAGGWILASESVRTWTHSWGFHLPLRRVPHHQTTWSVLRALMICLPVFNPSFYFSSSSCISPSFLLSLSPVFFSVYGVLKGDIFEY